MRGTPRGLVDQDIQPADRLRDRVGTRVDLTFGVDADEDALIETLDGVDVLFTTSRLPVTARVLANASDLDVVAKIGTGLDSIALDAARDNGVTVVYTPGVNALSVAEHAIALLLAVRRNVLRGHRTLEAGDWRDALPTSEPLPGCTVGIVGFGNVGSRVASLLDGFSVDVLAHDPYIHEIDTEITGAELVELDELLESSDAVVVCAELTEETRGLLDAGAFSRMRSDATLVNVSRGPIVDQDALVTALGDGEIGAVGLDVFEEEPLPRESRLHELDDAVLTPHIAASSIESRRACIDTLVDTAVAVLDDEPVADRFVAVRPG